MFLNYVLDETIEEFAELDMTDVEDKGRETGKREWYRRNITLMGFRSSPYTCNKGFAQSDEIIRGDVSKHDKYLRWDTIVLNLPVSNTNGDIIYSNECLSYICSD